MDPSPIAEVSVTRTKSSGFSSGSGSCFGCLPVDLLVALRSVHSSIVGRLPLGLGLDSLVDPLMGLVHLLVEVTWPSVDGGGQSHHVVARVNTLGLTSAAEVVVRADHALVAEAKDGGVVAAVACHALVEVSNGVPEME